MEHRSPEVARVVRYEINMFKHCYERVIRTFERELAYTPGRIEHTGTADTDESKRDESAYLEGFLLHARVLREFFYYFAFEDPQKKFKKERRKPDDVMAQDFIPDWDVHCLP